MPDAPSSELAFELAQAYWPEVERGPRQLLVVPVGSLEQHGPHLPLDTDTRIAVAVARRACAGRAGVALAPPLPVGASGEHAAFPGTLSIGSEALAPGAVRLDAAQRGDVRPLERILPLLRERGVRAVSANGVLGDPAGASAAEGEELLGHLTDGLTAAMDRFLAGGPGSAGRRSAGGGGRPG
jgi:creatinine amidohydrolase/Fe(II)-dependent formamide hydrolase-like protein